MGIDSFNKRCYIRKYFKLSGQLGDNAPVF